MLNTEHEAIQMEDPITEQGAPGGDESTVPNQQSNTWFPAFDSPQTFELRLPNDDKATKQVDLKPTQPSPALLTSHHNTIDVEDGPSIQETRYRPGAFARIRRAQAHEPDALGTQTRISREALKDVARQQGSITRWNEQTRSWNPKIRTIFESDQGGGPTLDIVVVYLYNGGDRSRNDDLDLFRYSRSAELALRSEKSLAARAKVPRGPKAKAVAVPEAGVTYAPLGTLDLESPNSSSGLKGKISNPPMKLGNQGIRTLKEEGSIDWLSDSNMLPSQFPMARITTIGFDVSHCLDISLDLNHAGSQLLGSIPDPSPSSSNSPILFIGHGYGTMLIYQSLLASTTHDSSTHSIFDRAAGVLSFSFSFSESSERVKMMSNHLSLPADAKIFSSLGVDSTSALETVKSAFKTKILRRPDHHMLEVASIATTEEASEAKMFTLYPYGFPIVSIYSRSELEKVKLQEEEEVYGRPKSSVIILDKDFEYLMSFSGPQDKCFSLVVQHLRTALQQFQLLHAAFARDQAMMETMISEEINVNMKDRWGQSALQVSVLMENESMVRLLLHKGHADPNIRDYSMNTPLHLAVRIGNPNIVETLLAFDADMDAMDDCKRTPKLLASILSSKGLIYSMLKGHSSNLIQGPTYDTRSEGSETLSLTRDEEVACKSSQITVTEIFASQSGETDEHWSVKISVLELLYESTPLEDYLRPVRPSSASGRQPICTWIHVPENNMTWIEDLFTKLHLENIIWKLQNRDDFGSSLHRTITPHASIRAGTISVFVPFISYEMQSRQVDRQRNYDSVNQDFTLQSEPLQYYRARESRESLIDVYRTGREKLTELVAEGLDASSGRFIRQLFMGVDVTDDEERPEPLGLYEEEKAVISAYLCDPPSLHTRKTLDQYFYHMLEDTRNRDNDQVVTRWARKRSNLDHKNHLVPHNILLVDQLWLWRTKVKRSELTRDVRNEELEYIITAFPDRTGVSIDSPTDKLMSLVLKPEHGNRDAIRDPQGLVSRILETCFNVFDRLQDDKTLRFLQMFEDSIGLMDDAECDAFGKFENDAERLYRLGPRSRDFNDRKRTLLETFLNIQKEIKLLVETKDIRDEINIIRSILNTQQDVIRQMTSHVMENETKLTCLFKQNQRNSVNSSVRELIHQNLVEIEKMDRYAQTVQDKLGTLMDLKQKASNAWDARAASESAIEAGKQGHTVLVFTVVTIIFLPLSFMSSFFALSIAVFPKDARTGQTDWPLGLILRYLFGISLSVSIPLVIFALNIEFFSYYWDMLWQDHIPLLFMALLVFLPGIRSDACSRYTDEWFNRAKRRRDKYLGERTGNIYTSAETSDGAGGHIDKVMAVFGMALDGMDRKNQVVYVDRTGQLRRRKKVENRNVEDV